MLTGTEEGEEFFLFPCAKDKGMCFCRQAVYGRFCHGTCWRKATSSDVSPGTRNSYTCTFARSLKIVLEMLIFGCFVP